MNLQDELIDANEPTDAVGDLISSGKHLRVQHQGVYVCDTCTNVLGLNVRWDHAVKRNDHAPGVRKLTCSERDEILLDLETGRPQESWGVVSTLTDAYGVFGDPRIETTWERDGRQIRDVRHPKVGQYSPPDERPCEHYELTGEDRK